MDSAAHQLARIKQDELELPDTNYTICNTIVHRCFVSIALHFIQCMLCTVLLTNSSNPCIADTPFMAAFLYFCAMPFTHTPLNPFVDTPFMAANWNLSKDKLLLEPFGLYILHGCIP